MQSMGNKTLIAFISGLLIMGCGATEKKNLVLTTVTTLSSVLDKVEQYADEQLSLERQKAIVSGDIRREREALIFWTAIYDLLNSAHNYLIAALNADDLGDKKALNAALRCYREILTDVNNDLIARGLSLMPFVIGLEDLLLPKESSKQCQY